jgi:transposase
MRKIKESLRLHHECKLKNREIGRSLSISHSTVGEYLNRAKEAGLGWPLPVDLDDEALEQLLFARPGRDPDDEIPLPDWRQVHRELRKKGVTRLLLWQEYRDDHPDGYSYSRFCELYHEWARKLKPTMRLDHKAGEKAFVDYAGMKAPYIDVQTGEIREATVFVSVLGASDHIYAEAQRAAELEDWIGGHVNAFTHWQGVPAILVVDNLKTGVRHPCRYEPDLNPTYHEMARHYGIAVMPTRVRAPRDKAKVEVAVQVVERWVLAPLRNMTFFGLVALNEAIAERLEVVNSRSMRHLGQSRQELFEELDRPALKPLPERPYELAVWKKARVNIDYHVAFDHNYYSVPYELIGQEVEVRGTVRMVEVFAAGQRVASHHRSPVRGKHTTSPEHMPAGHRQYAEWTPERMVHWAQKIGPETAALVAAVMASRPHPEQGFRSCLGILRLAKRFGDERLEAAARRALRFDLLSYKRVKKILEDDLDSLPLDDLPNQPRAPHANVRGGQYYH